MTFLGCERRAIGRWLFGFVASPFLSHLVPCRLWARYERSTLQVCTQSQRNENEFRLVALGRLQRLGVEYNEPFATVTTRLMIAIAESLDLEIEQMDVVTVITNGDQNEDI